MSDLTAAQQSMHFLGQCLVTCLLVLAIRLVWKVLGEFHR